MICLCCSSLSSVSCTKEIMLVFQPSSGVGEDPHATCRWRRLHCRIGQESLFAQQVAGGLLGAHCSPLGLGMLLAEQVLPLLSCSDRTCSASIARALRAVKWLCQESQWTKESHLYILPPLEQGKYFSIC